MTNINLWLGCLIWGAVCGATATPGNSGEGQVVGRQPDEVLDRNVKVYTYVEIRFENMASAEAFRRNPEAMTSARVSRRETVEGQTNSLAAKAVDAVKDGEITETVENMDDTFSIFLRIGVKECLLRGTYVGKEIEEERRRWERLGDANRKLTDEEKRVMSECLKTLASDPDESNQRRAIRRLEQEIVHVDILPALKKTLANPKTSWRVKAPALETARRVRDPGSVDLLIDALEDQEYSVRVKSFGYLKAFFDAHFDRLREAKKISQDEELLLKFERDADAKKVFAKAWRDWWAKNRDKVKPDWVRAQMSPW